jgi:hypothetical protein
VITEFENQNSFGMASTCRSAKRLRAGFLGIARKAALQPDQSQTLTKSFAREEKTTRTIALLL